MRELKNYKPHKEIYIFQAEGTCGYYAGTDKNGIIYADEDHPPKRYKEGVAWNIVSNLRKKYHIVRFEII